MHIRLIVLALAAALSASATAADAPTTALPYTPSLDLQSMDRTADPCSNFYQYACGGWMKNNPIPEDQSNWSVYGKLYQDNQRFLWGILQALAEKPDADPVQHKLGDYFAACMDESTVNERAVSPLRPALARVAAMKGKAELPEVLASLQAATASNGFFFSFGSGQDLGDASQVIAQADRGGLGLPDRDYYLKRDEKSNHLRGSYLAHVKAMFELLGDPETSAQKNADTVMAIETELAKASLSRVDRRDPYKLDHKMDLAGLQALTPEFDWSVYLARRGLATTVPFNVAEPTFFKTLAGEISKRSLSDIQSYLRWHLAHAMAPYLSTKFVDADFNFYRKTLRGVPQQQPRWKRCVALVDDQLGEALGREFMERAFSPEL